MLEFAPNTWAGGTSDPYVQWQEDGTGEANIITENPPGEPNIFTGSGALGAGKANTRRMQSINGLTEGTIPSYGTATGTSGQWYWPSQEELTLIRGSGLNLSGFGGEYGYGYWSSTDGSATNAYGVDFGVSGGLRSVEKNQYRNHVRIIRAFSAAVNKAPTIGSATISGTAKVGQVLTATANSVTGSPTPSRSYQWKAAGTNVGTNSSTYTIQASDLGKVITVDITVNNGVGSPAFRTSSATANVAAADAAPTIGSATLSGTAKVGQVLTAIANSVTGSPTPTPNYLWTANGSLFRGSTDNTYTIRAGDLGKAIGVIICQTNLAGYACAVSSATANVAAADVAPAIGSATISGTAKVGQTLTATANSVTGSPTPTASYQWRAAGTNVGTNSSTYTIQAGDLGKAITVVITEDNGASPTASATSSATAVVTALNPCAPKTCQTITFPRPANMLTTSADQLLSATSTSGLPVVFQTYAPAVCSVIGAVGSQYVRVVPSGAPQTCVINAMQSGNATYAPATWVQVGFNINKVAQTITFNQPSSMKRSDPDQPLSATSTSGLSVTFSSYTPSICTVVGTSIHPITATTNQYCVIAATQSGNAIYAGATPVTKSLYIGR
jgi:hypothetical protein